MPQNWLNQDCWTHSFCIHRNKRVTFRYFNSRRINQICNLFVLYYILSIKYVPLLNLCIYILIWLYTTYLLSINNICYCMMWRIQIFELFIQINFWQIVSKNDLLMIFFFIISQFPVGGGVQPPWVCHCLLNYTKLTLYG